MNLEGSEQAGTAMKALIVEDDESVAELVEHVLTREDFAVSVAHDCAAARNEIQSTDHDLVFLDLKLPDGDGLDLLAWLKERGSPGAVIVMTAFRQEEKALRAYDLGADDFICKPFKPRELLTRARHVLGARHTTTGSRDRRGA